MTGTTLLFAPGAGAPSNSAWMTAWTQRLSSLGEVVPFDYPYQQKGRRRPDPLPALVAAHRAALAQVRVRHLGPVVLAGKSMGSRIGCHVSLVEPVRALICFGYPLKSPSGKLRDQVLVELTTPVLFIQGTRDKLCPLDELEKVRARMRAPHQLYVVEGADHSLEVLRRQGAQEPVDLEILEKVRAFLASQPTQLV